MNRCASVLLLLLILLATGAHLPRLNAAPAWVQQVTVPGTMVLPAGASVTFSGGDATLLVTNGANEAGGLTAMLSYDGFQLRIQAPFEFYAIRVLPPINAACERVNGLQNLLQCTLPLVHGQQQSLSFTMQIERCAGPTLCPFNLHYGAGWNLLAVTPGTMINSNLGPFYTLQADDNEYESVPDGTALQPGRGYWAYFDHPTSVASGVFPRLDMPAQSVLPPLPLPLPAAQWVMIGNPYPVSVDVEGADALYVYVTGQGYQQTRRLESGQGAWAYSPVDGTVLFSLAAR